MPISFLLLTLFAPVPLPEAAAPRHMRPFARTATAGPPDGLAACQWILLRMLYDVWQAHGQGHVVMSCLVCALMGDEMGGACSKHRKRVRSLVGRYEAYLVAEGVGRWFG
jgi:hypothetical protein